MMFKFMGTIHSAADLAEQVEQFKRGLDTPVQGPPEDFGQRLKEATRRRLAPGGRLASIMAHVSAEDESFGQKVKRAAQEKSNSVKKTKERQQAARERYRKAAEKLKPRRHTKSD
jgi:hypothetical protein